MSPLYTFVVITVILTKSSAFLNEDIQASYRFLFPTSEVVKNEKCRNHSELYKNEFRKLTYWATQMFDASAKFPSGILSGSTFHYGNFDECIHINVPLNNNNSFSGKYCLTTIIFDIPGNVSAVAEDDPFSSTWQKLQHFATDRSKKPRNELRWAICIPSSCSKDDLLAHLEESISDSQLRGNQIKITIGNDSCQVLEEPKYSKLDINAWYFFYSIFLMILMSTIYELMCKKDSHPKSITHQMFISFSLISNSAKLFTVTPDPDRLEVCHGLRFWGMFFTIMAHRIMYSFGSPVVNSDGIEYMYSTKFGAGILNGSILIDVFYSITGFLAAFLMLTDLKHGKMRHYFIVCIHRIIRLSPLYAFVILYYSTLFINAGSGPIWREKIILEKERCLNSWWANMLYINNYVNTENMCIVQSWFIAGNMQLFFLSPLIAKLLYKYPEKTMKYLKITVVVFAVITFIQVYITKLDPTMITYYNVLKDVALDESFKTIYMPTHNRISAYLIGMMGGYIKYKMKEENLKIPRHYIAPGWWFTNLSMLGGMYIGFVFYIPGRQFSPLESALYSSLHHIFISASIVWMIFAVSYRKGKFIAFFLEKKPIVPLGRLTYSVYLCHVGVQMFVTNTQRVPYYSSVTNFFWIFFGDVVIIYLMGFILSMMFEVPFFNIENLVRGKGVKSFLVQRNLEKNEAKKM